MLGIVRYLVRLGSAMADSKHSSPRSGRGIDNSHELHGPFFSGMYDSDLAAMMQVEGTGTRLKQSRPDSSRFPLARGDGDQ